MELLAPQDEPHEEEAGDQAPAEEEEEPATEEWAAEWAGMRPMKRMVDRKTEATAPRLGSLGPAGRWIGWRSGC